MRVTKTSDGLTVTVIAGSYSILLAFNLTAALRIGCLGFTIKRVDSSNGESRYLPNMLRFRSDTSTTLNGSDKSPIQRFRWADYTAKPGQTYTYTIQARGGKPDALTILAEVAIPVSAMNPDDSKHYVFFNRAAAASQAYVDKFGDEDPDDMTPDKKEKALAWLSRGLKEALIDYIGMANGPEFSLHGAIYEFQNEELLSELKKAASRGVKVQISYHARHKAPPQGKKDTDLTKRENEQAITTVGIETCCHARAANPQGAIMHNKFLVLLKNNEPQAVWTGSTNWTDGGLYGQLNVGHAFFDADLATLYENYFKLLFADDTQRDEKEKLFAMCPPPVTPGEIKKGYTALFSPQSGHLPDKTPTMIDLYAQVCAEAKMLVVCAPFELHDAIKNVLEANAPGTLRFLMGDKEGSFGDINLVRGEKVPGNEISVATTISSPLHDFQNRIIMKKERFHHQGVHIHSKIIISNPLSEDPILIMGSANFSQNSSMYNDENSVIVRGDKDVVDIYFTEFMRLFDQYYFRYAQANALETSTPLGLSDDDSWSEKAFTDPIKIAERQMFSGSS